MFFCRKCQCLLVVAMCYRSTVILTRTETGLPSKGATRLSVMWLFYSVTWIKRVLFNWKPVFISDIERIELLSDHLWGTKEPYRTPVWLSDIWLSLLWLKTMFYLFQTWCDSCLLSILWKMIKTSGKNVFESISELISLLRILTFSLKMMAFSFLFFFFSKILINRTFFSELWTKKIQHFLTSGPNPLLYYLLLRYCAFVVNFKQGGNMIKVRYPDF